MLLKTVDLAGFRGFGALRLELDPTTVLVGEARVGKTTVLDAVAAVLAPRPPGESPFSPRDLRRVEGQEPPPEIRVTLGWEESQPGEWDSPAWEALAAACQGGDGPLRRLTLRVTGRPAGQEVAACWEFLRGDGEPLPGLATPERLDALRRLSPVLMLSATRYYTAASKLPGPGGGAADPGLVVQGIYRRAVMTRGDLSVAELRAGLDAARELRTRAYGRSPTELEAGPGRGLRELVETPRSLTPLPLDEVESSASAQNLALLLLVGSLLEARGDAEAIPAEASPLLLIEEPELHLHPIMAASLWGTLQRLPAQQVITTNSGELLAAAPLHALRRLTRPGDETQVFQLGGRGLSLEDLRRVGYHVRLMRGGSLFARCWLLVEGETEAWLLPELARRCGYVFASEGVSVLEFAQCGVRPLIRLANALGIEWHLLADGDEAGAGYERAALGGLNRRAAGERVSRMRERDIEHCLWDYGYDHVFREIADPPRRAAPRRPRRPGRQGGPPARDVIAKALRNQSKPFVALRVLEAMAEPGAPEVPPVLRRAIEAAVWLARASAGIPTPRPGTVRLARPGRRPAGRTRPPRGD